MLPPDRRELLLTALRPPEGYRFDCGIGTTYSLDLLTLLVVPLSLAWMDVADVEAALRDPVLLLESIRRCAGRLAIFCQAGRIAIPRMSSPLFRFLEDSVVEVQAPRRGGVFHPKVWLLRYARPDSTPGEAPFYRLLCLTRNLTLDRSWDLMLRLEGQVTQGRQRAYGRNNALGDFVQALPALAVARDGVNQRIGKHVDVLQDEVRRAAFQTPPGFDEHLAFYPSGIPGHRAYKFEEPFDRAMVISPFLAAPFLNRLVQRGQRHVLVSTVDTLAQLPPETAGRFTSTYVLRDSATAEAQDDGDSGAGSEAPGGTADPSGLHAKVFVLEKGWHATWLVGSANATSAAFENCNVEFMVELKGLRSQIGIDKLLGADGDPSSLRSLLKPYLPPALPEPPDQEAAQAEQLAEAVRAWLVSLKLQGEVTAQGDGLYTLCISAGCEQPEPPGSYAVGAWPVSLAPGHRRSFALPLVFPALSMVALTPFVAFEVAVTLARAAHTLRFVLKLPVSGMPEARDDQLLTAILSDRAQFLRLLRHMLLEEEDAIAGAAEWLASGQRAAVQGQGSWYELPLLEALVRALSRAPDKIERIGALVEQLERTPEGRALFPEGFEALWQAIKAAGE